MMDSFCQFLDWDSDFFGMRIARVTKNHLSDEIMGSILQWCLDHHIDCLYFLADGADGTTVRLAEDNHFRFVDIRMTLETQLSADITAQISHDDTMIRKSLPQDIPALRLIAKTSYTDSRFYYDKNFPIHLSNTLYEIWTEKSCQGFADVVLVAEIESKPIGYISCHLSDETSGYIGLIAVDEKRRGRQLGQDLVTASLQWFAEQGVTSVRVVTQGRNCSAQRLYQRCGFLTTEIQLWYHLWFLDTP